MKRIIKRDYFYIPCWIMKTIAVFAVSAVCALLFYVLISLITGEKL